MSEWLKGLLSLIMIHALKLKQLELSADVSTMKCDILLKHVTSESRENRDSLWGKGCLAATSLSHRSVVSVHISIRVRLSSPTHACSVCSHHVLREAGRGPAVVQDRRDRGAVRVRHRHGHVLLRPLGHDQEHLRGRSGRRARRQGHGTEDETRRDETGDGSVVRTVVPALAALTVPSKSGSSASFPPHDQWWERASVIP